MSYLVVMEVSQKQRYIFNTNRLSRNVGASIIIRVLTGEEDMKSNHGKIPYPMDPDFLRTGRKVFAGGGRSVFEFDTGEEARHFIQAFSTQVVRKCPGVELFMAMEEYDPEHEHIDAAVKRLYGKLEEKKALRQGAFAWRGVGCAWVSAELQQPAAEIHNGEVLSAEEVYKTDVAATMQDEFFSPLLPDPAKYRFAHEFEELGGTRGVKDYLAVIAIDGNKMGEKIKAFRESFGVRHPDSDDNEGWNEAYKKEFRAFSENLDACYRKAVKQAIGKTAANRIKDPNAEDGDGREYPPFGVDSDSGKVILPLRPLILSGDDICLVCDARFGLSLAKTILENIEEQESPAADMALHACAGVAMVHSHYPFFKAHELAEELCSSAKSVLPLDPKRDESAMDFMIVQGEITGSLSKIREKLYKNGTLTDKPLFLHEARSHRKNSVDYYEERLKQLTKNSARSKLKGYRDALSEGYKAALEYVDYKRMGGEDNRRFVDDGYDGDRCIDFDLIEIMDMHYVITEEARQ